jgi:hypothetical protein
MVSAEGPSVRRFSRAIRETLDAVVAPMVRDALIHDALAVAGLTALPEDNDAIRSFARGSLFAVMEQALGAELAQSVVDEILVTIHPVTEDAAAESRSPTTPRVPGIPPTRASALPTRPSSPPLLRRSVPPGFANLASAETAASVRSRAASTPFPVRRGTTPRVSEIPLPAWPTGFNSHIRPHQTEADPPPSGMTRGASVTPPPPTKVRATAVEAPFVLVSTEDASLFQTLSEWFGNRARVCRVRTPTDLVRLLDGASGIRAIVILDGKSPSIRPAALVALLEDLPTVEVVLCRAAAAIEHVILSASAATERWLIYREPASLDHVAAECLRLVS